VHSRRWPDPAAPGYAHRVGLPRCMPHEAKGIERVLARGPACHNSSSLSTPTSSAPMVGERLIACRVERGVPSRRQMYGRPLSHPGRTGTGAFGTMYRAEDVATRHLVAVRLPPSIARQQFCRRAGVRRVRRSLPQSRQCIRRPPERSLIDSPLSVLADQARPVNILGVVECSRGSRAFSFAVRGCRVAVGVGRGPRCAVWA
jgi:hypothetical protein